MRLPRKASPPPGLRGAWLTTLDRSILAPHGVVRAQQRGRSAEVSFGPRVLLSGGLRWIHAEGICGGREGALQLPRSEHVKICRLSGKITCLLRALVALTEDPNNLPQL